MKPRLGDRCGSETARAVGRLLEDAGRWVAPLGRPEWAFDLTDVLSFSGLEEVGAGPPDLAAGQAGAGTDLWLDPLHADDPVGMGEISGVGEIILAPDFIARRCAAQGWPLEKEIPMLVVHGCLHLLGWDHEEEERGRAMRRLESERLAACGLEHPLVGAKEDD